MMVVEERTVRAGYKMTEFGEIPVEWEILSLDDVLQQMTDYVANGSFQSLRENVRVYDEINYAMYVRLYDLRLGLGHSAQKYVDQKTYEFLSKSFLSGNEILIANIGANVGEVFLMPELTYPATIAPNMIVMRVESKHSYKYVYYYLSAEIGQNTIACEVSGSGQPKLNKTGLKRVKIAVPSLKEQKKIADILSTVDEQIENTEQLIEKTKELKKGLMQQLLTKGIGHTEFKMSELGEIPAGWEVMSLGESCEIIMGQSPKGESYNTKGHGSPLLNGPTEFGENFPKEVQWTTTPTKFCAKGDILFCVRGSSIGRMNVANKKYCIGRGLAAIRQNEKETITQYISFVLQFSLSNVLKNTSGSTFPNITKSELDSVILPIPSLTEQRKIADILSSIDEQIENCKQEKEKYTKLKKGMMQQLLTGAIRV